MHSLSIFYSPLYSPHFRIVQNSRASSEILFPGEYRLTQHWKIQLFPQFGGQEICHQERAFRFLTGKSPFHVSSNSYPLNMITIFPTSRNSPIITHDPLFFMVFFFHDDIHYIPIVTLISYPPTAPWCFIILHHGQELPLSPILSTVNERSTELS